MVLRKYNKIFNPVHFINYITSVYAEKTSGLDNNFKSSLFFLQLKFFYDK